ncbi:hypothetical protein ABEV41_00375 [Geobacillus thermodenitrificans]|jgi:hypothetical protein|uniref:hypothetical protein n=1 Tax=Geobacillus thermodenitrificans TaxID=33940 RepID=UPI003D1C9BA6
MKFTKLNENGLITKYFDTYQEAKEYFGSGVIPVLSIAEWTQTHKDYKGYVDGKPYILYLTDKGTTYGECVIVNEI